MAHLVPILEDEDVAGTSGRGTTEAVGVGRADGLASGKLVSGALVFAPSASGSLVLLVSGTLSSGVLTSGPLSDALVSGVSMLVSGA